MFPAPSRREFLGVLAGAAGLSTLEGRVFAAETALTSTRLGQTLTVIAGAGGNVLVAAGSDGLVMVNGGSRERSPQLFAELAKQFAGKRVLTLFNTDWHPDHTGSNEVVGQSGGAIVAHEHTKQYLTSSLAKAALPSKTFYSFDKMTSAGHTIEYGQLGQAHTDGDIYVFLREANVLAVGDVVSVGAYPIADFASGGWLGGMVTATKSLLDMSNAETKIVPGSGPLQTRADLEAQHQMLQTLRDRIGKMMRQGMGAEDMLAAGITKEFDAKWGDPRLFVTTSYRGMWLHVRELGGVV